MKTIFSPSIMCADFGNLREEVTALDAAGADVFHIDIMDGEFVPNFAMSWQDFTAIRSMTNKPIDVHLMVKNPDTYLPYALKYKADIIYIHYEVGCVENYLEHIKNNGVEAGLACNPDTKLEYLQPLLPLVDRLLVMRVHPGFSGSSPVPAVEEKLQQLTQIKNRNFKIALDGSVSEDVISRWSSNGVDEFVLGTACGLFGAKRGDRSYTEILQQLRFNSATNLQQPLKH